MKTLFIPYRQSSIELLQFGTGNELLILIHGFGDSAKLFKPFSEALSEKFTSYAISLPYHGATQWAHDFFDKDDLINIIKLVLEKEEKDRFALLGYSLGGKISLSLIQPFAHQLNRVMLFAPDGIKTHKLYDVTSLPPLLLSIIKAVMRFPPLFFALARLMHRKGILSKFVYDFTLNHFSTQQQRRRFFCVSRSVYFFVSDLEKVKSVLNQYAIPLQLFFGTRDEVILIEGGKSFKEGLNDCRLYELDRGHLMIDEEIGNHLKAILNQENMEDSFSVD